MDDTHLPLYYYGTLHEGRLRMISDWGLGELPGFPVPGCEGDACAVPTSAGDLVAMYKLLQGESLPVIDVAGRLVRDGWSSSPAELVTTARLLAT